MQHQQVLRLRLRDLSGTMVYASDGAGTITETALLTDPDRAALTLQRRADAGVRISIDKFGVGQTSLRCLASLPSTNRRSIAPSSCRFDVEPRNAAIVRSVIDLGHNLGFLVTAQGSRPRRS